MNQAIATTGSTRRRFLVSSGTATAAGAALLGPGLEGAVASVASHGGLNAHRRRTYLALVEAVGESLGTLADSSAAGHALWALDQRYRGAPSHVRNRMDAVLDCLDDGHENFASLPSDRRVACLVSHHDNRDDVGRAGMVRDAVALAAAPFHPGGFRWEPAGADIWLRVARARSGRA